MGVKSNPVVISIQHGDPRKQTYLRTTIGTLNKRAVLEAVETMLEKPSDFAIGTKPKPTFKGHKPKADAEVIPGT
jgi:hypothetical protein